MKKIVLKFLSIAFILFTCLITSANAAMAETNSNLITAHTSNNVLGKPVWITTTLPHGQYNTIYGTVNLNTMVIDSDGNTDTYTFYADFSHPNEVIPPWLALNSNGILQGISPIPNSSDSTVYIAVIAESNTTKLMAPATLVLHIIN
ncbi:MAG TPA: hypothetical protein VHE99_05385 [Gammaproteobacteria bacterium]|nr:hypothetical protein [Gammaproteobacteria bacterium]